jgi:hypothetical protein
VKALPVTLSGSKSVLRLDGDMQSYGGFLRHCLYRTEQNAKLADPAWCMVIVKVTVGANDVSIGSFTTTTRGVTCAVLALQDL